MGEARKIMSVLKDTGTSRFTQILLADQLIPSVAKAIEVKERGDADELQKVFHTPRIVSQGCHFAYSLPEKRPHYKPLIASSKALNDLQLEMEPELVKLVSGEKVYYDQDKNSFPYSMAYAGFQFGHFAGQLGDGRVVNIADITDKHGIKQTLQLKGSGLTPFSRFADGKAVLRSSIREFIISEALHHIGIPSTRALHITSLPKTKAKRALYESCAVVCRFAPTWVRIGNFDLCRWRQDHEGLVKLSDFCIDEVFHGGEAFPVELDLNCFMNDFFPDSDEKVPEGKVLSKLVGTTKYELFFRHVINLNAESVAYWQSYGFLNGVLNTDNTSIMGLAMDFGPFSFIDKFQPQYTPNHDDVENRYSYANQAGAIWWNLSKFAQAMTALIGAGPKYIDGITSKGLGAITEKMEDDIVTRANTVIALAANEFKFRFTTRYADIMAKRIGIDLGLNSVTSENLENLALKASEFNHTIIEPMLQILYYTQIDYNNFFVKLQMYDGDFISNNSGAINGIDPEFVKVFFTESQIEKLSRHYFEGKDDADSGETVRLVECMDNLRSWVHVYTRLIPSEYKLRYEIAKKVNPLFTPRSYIFEQVIQDLTDKQRDKLNDPGAELDTSLLEKLYKMSANPYEPAKWDENLRPEVVEDWITHGEEEDKFMKQCSCSS
ncbi:LAFE_0C03950g1_1 [Lachancea fermentati]|uniref:Selenoprotein O n=1 Tax=Lachancea fermentati TaxID=4955 RepID=A0A1G4M9C7_LACFM|nr:LAFE_0C03950g1_1 [Lachancea fermentati]